MKSNKLLLIALAMVPAMAFAQAKPNPFSKAVPTPAQALPQMPGQGMAGNPTMGVPGMPGMVSQGPEVHEEQVSGELLGKVNGWNVFKATSGYVFDKTKEKSYVKRPMLKSDSSAGAFGALPGMPSPSVTPGMPPAPTPTRP